MKNKWHNSHDAIDLLVRQRQQWQMLDENFRALRKTSIKYAIVGGYTVKVQHNPTRISSATSIRKVDDVNCVLCPNALHKEQEALSMGDNFVLLCNPYPIFPEHFTIVFRKHKPQSIREHFTDFLNTAKHLNRFTVFYNGPESGASSPNHLHFQAVTNGIMPIDRELYSYKWQQALGDSRGRFCMLTGHNRNGFLIEAKTEENALALFERLYRAMGTSDGENREPKMNIFAQYNEDDGYLITVIPREKHRPSYFEEEGEDLILVSPGAADIGGLVIAPRMEDYHKLNGRIIDDIYAQVCCSDKRITEVTDAFNKD